MKIDYIKLKNFRQFRDETIRFFPVEEGERTFVVIEGQMGAGKTNLLNAITWCLYGEEVHMDKKYEGLPMPNTASLRELSTEEDCKVEVEIQMKEETGEKILFRRMGRFLKSEEGAIKQIEQPSFRTLEKTLFEVIRQKNGDMKIVPNPNFILQRKIPKSIREYFFFDGERLDEYFRETPKRTIKSEVHKISQMDLLEKAIQHIDRRKNTFLKKSEDLSPEVEDIRKELKLMEDSLEDCKEETIEIKQDRDECEKNEQEYREKLKASPDIGEKEKEREKLDEELKELEKKIGDLDKKKSTFLTDFALSIFSRRVIEKTVHEIGGKIEAGEIPPDYKRNFLRKLLDKNECICGADLLEGTERRKRLGTLLKETDEISDSSSELIKLNANLERILDKTQEFELRRKELNEEFQDLEENRSNASRRIKDIDELISGVGAEKIREWESRVQEYKKKKEDKIQELGKRNFKIRESKKRIKKLKKNLREELKKEDKYSNLEKIISFCDVSLETLKSIKAEIMGDTRKEIEMGTNGQFFSLIWNPDTFKEITIGDEYEISITHSSGYEAMGTLSAGQRQVLALSFMASLNRCSGFDVPIFIDTPLGRISGTPRNNIAANFPDYLEGKQVILLMTDTEYSPEVRERLSSRIGKEYKIEFTKRDEGSIAKVVPYD